MKPNLPCPGALPAIGLNRRHFLNRFGMGLGGIALASLLTPKEAASAAPVNPSHGGILSSLDFHGTEFN